MRCLSLIAALALSGCATSYQLTVMPRDSGKLYSGVLEENASGEGRISVALDGKSYEGAWVPVTPGTVHGSVYGGWGWGGWGYRRGWGGGGTVIADNPAGSHGKALLNAADGSGLRCDLRMSRGRGGGVCLNDQGKEFDVQMRPASKG
jgi:hypothetical protein